MKNSERHACDLYEQKNLDTSYLDWSIKTVKHIHLFEAPGDILLLLNDNNEIEFVCRELYKCIKKLSTIFKIIVLPLYFNAKMMQPTTNSRRVFLIADGVNCYMKWDDIAYTIDTGFVKQRSYDQALGICSSVIVPISEEIARKRTCLCENYRKYFRLCSGEIINDANISALSLAEDIQPLGIA